MRTRVHDAQREAHAVIAMFDGKERFDFGLAFRGTRGRRRRSGVLEIAARGAGDGNGTGAEQRCNEARVHGLYWRVFSGIGLAMARPITKIRDGQVIND
jgi:hypothetical protein